jgi:hypothetical protein
MVTRDGSSNELCRVRGGALVREIAPRRDERFVFKPRYSAFDHTPLQLILDELGCERLLLAGMTTEGMRGADGHCGVCARAEGQRDRGCLRDHRPLAREDSTATRSVATLLRPLA